MADRAPSAEKQRDCKFCVPVELYVYAPDAEAAKEEVRSCLNTGKGIDGYVIGDATQEIGDA